jgi:hypothetical protein
MPDADDLIDQLVSAAIEEGIPISVSGNGVHVSVSLGRDVDAHKMNPLRAHISSSRGNSRKPVEENHTDLNASCCAVRPGGSHVWRLG